MSFGAQDGSGMGRGMYARHRLDLSAGDVLFGVLSCGRFWRRERLEAEISSLCSLGDEGLVCLSVRSGWDLWLAARGLRVGDEVLVSAVTHPDMVRIIRAHGLRAVPVDIDPETLAVRPAMLEAALTPRTRVVLVAHLFGGRMDLGPVARFAKERGLLLVEDFAQASYPSQRRAGYLKKLLKVLGLGAASRPHPYGLLAWACTKLGSDLDELVNGVVRGFPPGEPEATFLQRLRQRPSAPLLAMLSRRLRTFDRERLARRASTGERFLRRLRAGELHPGRRSLERTHWLFPVVVADPEALIAALRGRGLDASQATSSISVVGAPDGRSSPTEGSLMMSGVVFLPVYPELPSQEFDVMAGLVNECAVLGAAERVAL